MQAEDARWPPAVGARTIKGRRPRSGFRRASRPHCSGAPKVQVPGARPALRAPVRRQRRSRHPVRRHRRTPRRLAGADAAGVVPALAPAGATGRRTAAAGGAGDRPLTGGVLHIYRLSQPWLVLEARGCATKRHYGTWMCHRSPKLVLAHFWWSGVLVRSSQARDAEAGPGWRGRTSGV
jgi:hypothetical protein